MTGDFGGISEGIGAVSFVEAPDRRPRRLPDMINVNQCSRNDLADRAHM